MSANLVQLYVQQYATTLQLLLQVKGSRLRRTVMEGPQKGSGASPVDQIGAVEAQKVTGRFQDIPRTDAPVDRRWVFPADYDLAQLVDTFDELRLINDPKASLVTNGNYAMGRAQDKEIVAGIFGTNMTGTTSATTAVPFLATQVINVGVGAAGATGLNVEKLRQANQLMKQNEVDPDETRTLIYTAKQESDLLREIQATSSDFNGGAPVMVDGRIKHFMGFDFERFEALPTGTDDLTGTSTKCPFYVKSGVYLGVWGDIMTDVTQRKDLRGLPWQVYAKETIGATRLEEKKVGFVWCR